MLLDTHHDSASLLLRECAEPIADIKSADTASLLARARDARVVCIGEGSHGTSEFYRMRAHVTRALVELAGFDTVAIEGDWPDAAHVDAYIGGRLRSASAERAFTRFPTWMWRNVEVATFVEWAKEANERRRPDARIELVGLDLYSMYSSLDEVLRYLDAVDPEAAARARDRYACLMPWEPAIQLYGHAASAGLTEPCEREVVAMMQELLARRLDETKGDGDALFGAAMNARLVADAERYYRAMFEGNTASWNLRDTHMVDTLEAVLAHRGPASKAVVWAHNSHVGDARATELGRAGETNVGALCRERFGAGAYLVGMGTDRGTVAAAADWDAPMEVMDVRPSLPASIERACLEAAVPAFVVHIKEPRRSDLVDELTAQRLQRAIGVVYRPRTERQSHYFHTSLARQFDAWIWFETTHAVTPLDDVSALVGPASSIDLPDTFPTGM